MFPVLEVFTSQMQLRGNCLKQVIPAKMKALTFLILLLLFIASTALFLPTTKADAKIISISPSSGYVGANVTLTANVSSLGLFRILFDETVVLSENTTGYNVTAYFTVPQAPQGSHNVTIVDAAGENATVTFNVLTFKSFTPNVPESPAQLQEGADLSITVNITGGLANYAYPKLKVQTPRADNYTLRNEINITTDDNGTCLFNVTYPHDFTGGANTNFTGYYKMFFNETEVGKFFIGLTNASEYHRGDVVNIKAVDYPLYENVTITLKFGNETLLEDTYNVADGTVTYDWVVPDYALLSNSTNTYNITITPISSAKNLSDTQTFEIPGFKTQIYTLNLANKTVAGVLVRIYDEWASERYANVSYMNSSRISGYTIFMLEKGNYTAEAYFKNVKVGDNITFAIAEESSLNFTCQLTSLIINVESEQGVRVPFVELTLAYNYTTNYGVPENVTETERGKTGIDGQIEFASLLPNVTYVVNASLYGIVFNIGNGTIQYLPAVDYLTVTVLCPTRRLHIKVLDSNGQPFSSTPDRRITVNARELTVGFTAEDEITGGAATLDCIFGNYSVKVFLGDILLNSTIIELLSSDVDVNTTLNCALYGLTIAVNVVDYFGQPISGANVTLKRSSLQDSGLTDSSGIVAFGSMVGGEVHVSVCLPGFSSACVSKTIYVESSATFTIKLDKYVVLAGFLVETSHLATAIVLAVALIFVVIIEVYRRKRVRSEKSQNAESE